MPVAQLLADAGNAIDGARAYIDRLAAEHVNGLREIASQAEDLAATAGADSPEAHVTEVIAAALDDLKSRAATAFAPPPRPASADPPGTPEGPGDVPDTAD